MNNMVNQTEDSVQVESSPKEEKVKKIFRIIRFVLDLLQTLFKKISPSA